jgi:hypothetical protein
MKKRHYEVELASNLFTGIILMLWVLSFFVTQWYYSLFIGLPLAIVIFRIFGQIKLTKKH